MANKKFDAIWILLDEEAKRTAYLTLLKLDISIKPISSSSPMHSLKL
jgi:hypothetical protein